MVWYKCDSIVRDEVNEVRLVEKENYVCYCKDIGFSFE